MSTPTFRSLVCSRARPELHKTGQALSNYFREFSTTQSLADDAPSGGAPSNQSSNNSSGRGRGGTARERGRAAASAINSMVRSRGPSSNGYRPTGNAASAAGPGSGAPKVLDVRSLPRGLGRGRGGAPGGGFRGRGGFSAGGAGGSGGSGTNRFAGAAGGGRGGRGRGAGARGAARGGPRGGATRGGARGGARGGKREGEQGGDRPPRRERDATDPFERMDDAELAFDAAIRFGIRQPYNPTLDVAGILTHAPAVPTSATGRRAAVMESLNAMGGGTGDAVGAANNFIPNAVEGRVQDSGLAFFATLEARGWAEEHITHKKSEAAAADPAADADVKKPVFTNADKTVQAVVFDAAVAGKHEAPAFATDVHGVVRSQQLRTRGYDSGAMASFQAKLQSLVGATKPAAAKTEKPAAGKETKKKAKEAKA